MKALDNCRSRHRRAWDASRILEQDVGRRRVEGVLAGDAGDPPQVHPPTVIQEDQVRGQTFERIGTREVHQTQQEVGFASDANPKLNVGGGDLDQVDRLPHRGAEPFDLPGVLGDGQRRPTEAMGSFSRVTRSGGLAMSFTLGLPGLACRDGLVGAGLACALPDRVPLPHRLSDGISQPDQVTVQGRLTVPPLVVRGLMAGTEAHVVQVALGRLKEVGYRRRPVRVTGGDALRLRELEPGDVGEALPGGELLADIAGGMAGAADPFPHRGPPLRVHGVAVVGRVQVTVGAAGGSVVDAVQREGPVGPADVHQDPVLGGRVAVGDGALVATGAGGILPCRRQGAVPLAVAGDAIC